MAGVRNVLDPIRRWRPTEMVNVDILQCGGGIKSAANFPESQDIWIFRDVYRGEVWRTYLAVMGCEVQVLAVPVGGCRYGLPKIIRDQISPHLHRAIPNRCRFVCSKTDRLITTLLGIFVGHFEHRYSEAEDGLCLRAGNLLISPRVRPPPTHHRCSALCGELGGSGVGYLVGEGEQNGVFVEAEQLLGRTTSCCNAWIMHEAFCSERVYSLVLMSRSCFALA
ncbi:hypothetical protein RRG08_007079 [Elysia crispata]|uniref:Uncharacterized protein n=1 Tax=Elysia crispata TaxID=231223 RepID=A0AAE0YNT4_9GAST|nr:hypothetical protein RRG08_007079 [Elysia crispata]